MRNIEVSNRIQGLIDELYRNDPPVEIERACLLTESYKQTENQPMVIRRARAFEKIMNEMTLVIRPNELIVGNFAVSPRGVQLFPEFSNKWLEDEFDSINKRTGDRFFISDESKKILREVFKYWDGKTTQELATQYMYSETITAMDVGAFTVGNYYFNGVGHISVDYRKVLQIGFKGIIAEAATALVALDKGDPDAVKKSHFYESVIISANAVVNYAKRFAKLAQIEAAKETNNQRKQELLQIAKNCENVPENPARNFWEACQSFWFIQAAIQIESNGHSISPGRFDQYMFPYYEACVINGTMSEEQAQELLDCLWVKLNDVNKIRDEASTKGFGGYPMFQNLIVGGQTVCGRDATNPLSYACLTASAHVKLPQPSISIRVWNKTPQSLMEKAAEVTRIGLGMPAWYNDEVIIPALENRGVSLNDARDYCIIGCVEPQVGGKTEGWHDAAFFNMLKVLEVTLNNGMDGHVKVGLETGDLTSFQSYNELEKAYRKQMEWFVKLLVNADNAVDVAHGERAPLPFLSCMVDNCIAKGKTLQEGGAQYNFTGPQGVGVANVGDALMAIKTLVFEQKKLTLTQLKEVLGNNFGHGKTCAVDSTTGTQQTDLEALVAQVVQQILAQTNKSETYKAQTNNNDSTEGEYIRQMLINGAPKYGNDLDEADDIAREAALIYCTEVQRYKNPRGGCFQPGLYPVSANVPMGLVCGATPDGRLAGQPLAEGVSPISGYDKNGPTAALNSVAKLDHHIASNGTLLNQKFHPSALSGQEGLANLAALVRGYFDHKGMHVQFNVIDRETLRKAQQDPERYKNLVVRVAGYSAHFVSLDKSIQDDIISRTEQLF
ncbi:glycyl radical protein [Entomomonas moraniae]|uniref:Glycyl radical protein n=1 Tax=Entomomonas moraniae TaxID=2213226 RepID=A0A3Q9JM35_9GAMM|nr:glycyl radical protein [Entomomonas moraniae]AZS50320.1 glycyl radical protein [Entomomonas moraniae]